MNNTESVSSSSASALPVPFANAEAALFGDQHSTLTSLRDEYFTKDSASFRLKYAAQLIKCAFAPIDTSDFIHTATSKVIKKDRPQTKEVMLTPLGKRILKRVDNLRVELFGLRKKGIEKETIIQYCINWLSGTNKNLGRIRTAFFSRIYKEDQVPSAERLEIPSIEKVSTFVRSFLVPVIYDSFSEDANKTRAKKRKNENSEEADPRSANPAFVPLAAPARHALRK